MFPRRNILLLAVAALVLILVGAAVLILTSSGDDEPATAVGSTSSPTALPATPEPDATPPIPGGESGHRLVIEKANVDAPISHVLVAREGGVLPAPETPDDVAFYDFSNHPGIGGFPGEGGNSILSGHVDSGRKACKDGTVPAPCEAVFWDLSDLEEGDIIEVHLGPQWIFRYSVTTTRNIDANATATWETIWPSTDDETITLITCAGDFNRDTGEYTSRLVVSGVRVYETASAPP
jgi:sortase A